MRRSLAYFCLVCFALWAVVAGGALVASGVGAARGATVAALLCFLPTALTIVILDLFRFAKPEDQALFLFGAVPVRMIPVLGGGWYLLKSFPVLTDGNDLLFWGWIILFYLSTLTVEVVIVGRQVLQSMKPTPPTPPTTPKPTTDVNQPS